MIANAGWSSKLMVALLCVVAGVPLDARGQPATGNPSPRRGWLGLQVEDPESGARSQGVTVVDILAGSPAASAGLRVGDRIGAVNGRPIGTRLELGRLVSRFPPGTALKLSVLRGNRVREVAVTLGEPPPPDDLPANEARATPAPVPARSGDSSPRSSSTRAPSPSSPYHDDTESPDRHARGNVDVCAAICRREDECNLWSYDGCMKACSPNDRDAAKYPARAKMSCHQLAVETGFAKEYSGSGSGQWSCRAVGTFVHAYNGAPDYSSPSNIDVTKYARTRDLAGLAALNECSGMMSLETNQAVRPGSLTTDFCKIIRCSR
jgi:PDZ domain